MTRSQPGECRIGGQMQQFHGLRQQKHGWDREQRRISCRGSRADRASRPGGVSRGGQTGDSETSRVDEFNRNRAE